MRRAEERVGTHAGTGQVTIDVRRTDGVCILDLAGPMTFPAATAGLRSRWKKLLDDGERLFVINMLEVPWLDSSGIGEVVSCYKRAREKNGIVKLVLRESPHTSFTYCHLDKMFEMFDSLDSAVSSFRPDPATGRPASRSE